MTTSSTILQLDVIAVHPTPWGDERADHFRTSVSTVVERLERSIGAEHPSVRLRPRYFTSEQANALGDVTASCAVAILDITECDERLALFIGRLQGAQVPHVLICQKDSQDRCPRIGLNNPELIFYRSPDDLIDPNSILHQELARAIPQGRIHRELIYRFWFPRVTSTIWVVCPQIHEPGEYAARSSPDYTYLDNLGDTDGLLEVMVFLSQYYPNATIERFSSADLPEGHTSSNLVVIGGPGSDEIRNEICREMMSAVKSHIVYSSDCEQMHVTGGMRETVELRAEYRTSGQKTDQAELRLRKDHGYFARFANPLNENAGVVLINGIHTAGVLGAARAFSQRREAIRNFEAVLASGSPPTSFECHFEVPVLNGQVKVPIVDSRDIFVIGTLQRTGGIKPANGQRRTALPDGRTSVRVLFIAGDRGGSQVNQLQITKEYDAIQDALHACEHRDLIALANPVLGATREKLAEAYRERPAVAHFAGHGNDRSLSIIEDRGLLANEMPLDGEQLCEMFRTMQDPVRLCVLNTCGSEPLARLLVEKGAVQSAIGWSARVSDSAAISFSRALYGALGDGRSIFDAVRIAKVASGTGDEPVLVTANGSDHIVLVGGDK